MKIKKFGLIFLIVSGLLFSFTGYCLSSLFANEREESLADQHKRLIKLSANGDLQELKVLLEDISDTYISVFGEKIPLISLQSNGHNKTALTEAVLFGHSDVVSTLLDYGADIEAQGRMFKIFTMSYMSRWVYNPLTTTTTPNDLLRNDKFQYIYPERFPFLASPLSVAIANNKPSIVKLLIDRGADVNSRDVWGWTPLHWLNYSITNHSWEIAEILINNGADPRPLDNYGYSPLDIARGLSQGSRYIVEDNTPLFIFLEEKYNTERSNTSLVLLQRCSGMYCYKEKSNALRQLPINYSD